MYCRLLVFLSLFMFSCAAPTKPRNGMVFHLIVPVNLIADENEFGTNRDHLPTPPPMPEHRSNLRARRNTEEDDTYSFSFQESDRVKKPVDTDTGSFVSHIDYKTWPIITWPYSFDLAETLMADANV